MSVEISEEPGRGARLRAREATLALLAIPKNRPRLFAVAWTALLLVLCLAPERVTPDERSLPVKRYLPNVDLVVHFGLFAGFAASWIRAGRSPRRWLVVAAAGLLLAVGTELAQGLSFIHRDPNVSDAAADSVGVLAGLAGMATLQRRQAGRDAQSVLP